MLPRALASPVGEPKPGRQKMRKLAIALGVSAAMLIAGGIAWKADATT
jgi:hypothetical protein